MDREKQARIREEIQKQAEQYSLQNQGLLIEWPTSSGKGRAVMMCIAASPSPKKWLIVVPEVIQIANFMNDLTKHNFAWLLNEKIEAVICYASFTKYAGRKLNLAFNEVHRLSELRADIGSTVQFDQILADSATVPEPVKVRLYSLCAFKEYRITVKEGIDIGLLPEPAIYTYPVALDDVERTNEVKTTKFTRRMTDKGYNAYLEGQIDYWQKRYDQNPYQNWMKNKIVNIGGERKRFIAECKTEDARELIQLLGRKRLICFCGSINQCEELGGPLSIHSKKSKKKNLEILEAFNSTIIDQIYVNRMGREGLNLAGIEAVVLVQLDSGNDEGLSFIQTTGRGMRADDPEVYILYCKDTMDEKYLHRALWNVERKYVKEFGSFI